MIKRCGFVNVKIKKKLLKTNPPPPSPSLALLFPHAADPPRDEGTCGGTRVKGGGVCGGLTALIVNKKNTKTRKIDTVKRRRLRADEGRNGSHPPPPRQRSFSFSFRRNEAWKIGSEHFFSLLFHSAMVYYLLIL